MATSNATYVQRGEALDFANRAAAISVTRRGAQPSLPYLHEMSTR